MKLIAEFICSPNRKEIYEKNIIFLTNSIFDDVIFDESIYDYTDSSDFWSDIFPNEEKGIYKLVLKMEIKGCNSYSHYDGVYEYDEDVFVEEILIKDKLKSLAEVKYIAKEIKEQNKGVL